MRYPLVVAITGASGTVYAQRLLERALDHFETIGLTVSRHAFRVMQEELQLESTPAEFRPEMLLPGVAGTDRIYYHGPQDRKSTRLNSSHPSISYAVFCLKKKT